MGQAFIFKLSGATAETLYDVILPYLCDAPLEEALAVNAQQDETEWKTPQVLETSFFDISNRHYTGWH